MKKLLTIFVLLIILFSSCQNDDNNAANDWSVINFSGGLMGINQSYEIGEVVWIFGSNTIQILHNFTPGPNEVGPYPDPGIYNYQWVTTNGETFLYIDGVSYGKVTYDGNLMYLDNNPGADGFYYILEKL